MSRRHAVYAAPARMAFLEQGPTPRVVDSACGPREAETPPPSCRQGHSSHLGGSPTLTLDALLQYVL